MNIYGNEINLEDCYYYLGCKQTDSLDEIRKKFFYKLSFLEYYFYSIQQHYKNIKSDTEYFKCEKELRRNEIYIRLVCDSYLAILLYKTDRFVYKHIISGLCEYFKNSSINKENFFPLLEQQIKENSKEIFFESIDDYLNELKIHNHSSTSAGVYLSTSSLSSIISLESEKKAGYKNIKCLVYKNEPKYGTDATLKKIIKCKKI